MKLLGASSPMQLAGWSAVGCLLLLAAYESMDSKLFSTGHQVFLFLFLIALGLALVWIAGERLGEGIRNQQWSEAEVDALRRLLAHKAFFAIPLLMLGLIVVSAIVSRSLHTPAAFWPLFWTNMAVQRLHRAIRKEPPASEGGGWRDALPIRSEHWGERQSS